MTDRFRVVPAAYVLLRRFDAGSEEVDPVEAGRGEVLLQLRQGTGYMDGYWALAAAGHVEADESVLDAACREVAEELGVVADRNGLQALCAMHRTGGNGSSIDERVDFFFECRRWVGEPRIVEPEKTADLRWFTLDALPEPVVPHERVVLEHVRRGEMPRVLTFGFDED